MRLSCSQECAAITRKRRAETYRGRYPKPRETRFCRVCGWAFRADVSSPVVTCGRACGAMLAGRTRKAADARRRLPLRRCTVCHGEFRAQRGQRTCSPGCADFADAPWRATATLGRRPAYRET